MNMFKPSGANTPEEYISKIEEPRKTEFLKIFDLIKKIMPDDKPFIVASMIGFRSYHYKSKSGREGDWPIIAIASQKNYISVYICATDGDQYVADKYKDELPKASVGKSCIRFKKAEDIDLDVLEKIIKIGLKHPFAI